MNDCVNAEMRDELPALMHGRLSAERRALVEAHLDTCTDCRAELELLERVRASMAPAPRVDTTSIAGALSRPGPRISGAWLVRRRVRFAAAAGLILAAAGLLTFAGAERLWVSESAPAGEIAGTAGLVPDGAFDDLTESDLRSLLAALDDFDGLPAVEPRSVASALPVLGEEL